MTDHHALITQLCDELDHNHRMLLDDRQVTHPLADRARAALAHQPDFRALCAELLLFSEQAGEICTCEGLWPKCDPNYTLLNRARAALAADGPAVPEGREPAAVVEQPSDEELLATLDKATATFPPRHPEAEALNVVEYSLKLELRKARAVLARWGHQPAPPAEGEDNAPAVTEVIAWLRTEAEIDDGFELTQSAAYQRRAADLLGQRHPTPVPVAEGEAGEESWYPDFADWLEREMPEGTVIGDPLWWASKIADRINRIADLLSQQRHPEPVPVSERLPGPEDCLDEGWAWFFSPRVGWRQAVCPVSPAYTHWLPAHALPLPAEEVE